MKIHRPHRREHHCTQSWNAEPERIFPLLCPVREMDWIEGWHPSVVISDSGLIEPECVFVEPDAQGEATWIVTHYDADQYQVEMYRILPAITVSKFCVHLTPADGGKTCAEVRYTQQALTDKGDATIDSFTETEFETFMAHFTTSINHYLDKQGDQAR